MDNVLRLRTLYDADLNREYGNMGHSADIGSLDNAQVYIQDIEMGRKLNIKKLKLLKRNFGLMVDAHLHGERITFEGHFV